MFAADFSFISAAAVVIAVVWAGLFVSVVWRFFKRLWYPEARGPVAVWVKGSDEPIVIPAHYEYEAVETMLRQFKQAQSRAASLESAEKAR